MIWPSKPEPRPRVGDQRLKRAFAGRPRRCTDGNTRWLCIVARLYVWRQGDDFFPVPPFLEVYSWRFAGYVARYYQIPQAAS